MKVKPIGYIVVGDGKHGSFGTGKAQKKELEPLRNPSKLYWENRGYELVKIYIKDEL